MGFTVPSAVTVDAVSSYLAVSPLPDLRGASPTHGLCRCKQRQSPEPSAVCSLLHFPLPWALRPYSTQPLAGILPNGARTFLPIPKYPAIAWPTFRGGLYAAFSGRDGKAAAVDHLAQHKTGVHPGHALDSGNFIEQQMEISVLNERKLAIEKQIKQEQKELKKVQNTLNQMDTLEFIEKQAREKLRMIKPGETVYIDLTKKKN